ncbi:uncharacterized protein LOC127263819 [Andrographis paniculata]|uniref:uncharacterized protein LOC127263819 n=1 Tax=Andrographis paniculata TaxID=175694 RepID=UPI0021E86160|nr:uncharacterized protein LOC127263819 [Andrographis paniculata]XP_051149012.1 uncharacterized protein LOC127263819 [Andrographis paniculata]
MGDESFDEKSLTEKLSKLNSSQQSIESLSRWCISHRKKAKPVVETWDKIFKSVQHEQQVSLLYLSNDIMQNSRRKGSEFVNEFWKVLPASLKLFLNNGDENSRKVASRLIDIWEERKVFGSRGANLKNELLGKNPTPIINVVKSPNPIKVVKRDSTSLRIKLAVGGLPEKILTAFHSVYDGVVNEDSALNKFHDAVSCVQEIAKDVLTASQGSLDVSDIVDNIQKQENIISQCISDLENSESIRVALLSHLREALQEQESKLEQIWDKIRVARGQVEQASNIRLQLTSTSSAPPPAAQQQAEATFSLSPTAITATTMSAPSMTFTKSGEEESKKAAAAAVAAKLAASTSSAQMLTSILSSLVAEEAAASMTGGGLKRPRVEPPMPGNNDGYFLTNMMSGPTQSTSQVNLPAPFLPPPLLPLPLAPPATAPANQFVQPNMMGLPFSYSSSNLQLPLPSNPAMGLARSGPPQQPQQPQGGEQSQLQSAQPPQPPQPPASGGFFRPIGVGFYGQSHQPPTPPIHRQ